MTFDEKIIEFITLCHREEVRMILVGGGAVNFHGYQRHSADARLRPGYGGRVLTGTSKDKD